MNSEHGQKKISFWPHFDVIEHHLQSWLQKQNNETGIDGVKNGKPKIHPGMCEDFQDKESQKLRFGFHQEKKNSLF